MLLLAIYSDLLRPVYTDQVFAEYVTVLGRAKFSFVPEDVTELLALLRAKGQLVVALPSGLTSPDPGDTKFIDCAVAAQADFMVTGNRRHFPAKAYGTAEVVTAATLLDRLTLQG